MKYRADCKSGRWTVDALMPAINDLSAWVTIADCGKPDQEDEMFYGFDAQHHAQFIASALNANAAALRNALADIAPICWLINDTTDRSEADRYYLASTNQWDDLHAALHKHADVISSVEDAS